MQIKLNDKFHDSLDEIMLFISLDSMRRAIDFRDELYRAIYDIPFMPYRFAKNRTLNNEKVRSLLFKRYVVPFRIDDETIEILNIYKMNQPKF